jgi:hypothetical protein
MRLNHDPSWLWLLEGAPAGAGAWVRKGIGDAVWRGLTPVPYDVRLLLRLADLYLDKLGLLRGFLVVHVPLNRAHLLLNSCVTFL